MMTISVNSAAGAKGNEANFVTDANGNVTGLEAPTAKIPINGYRTRPVRVGFIGDSTGNGSAITGSTPQDMRIVDVAFPGSGTTSANINADKYLLSAYYPQVWYVANCGVSGDTTTQLLARDSADASSSRKAIYDAIALGIDVAIYRISINDFQSLSAPIAQATLDAIVARYRQGLQRLVSAGIPVIVEGVAGYSPPSGLAADIAARRAALVYLNAQYKALCATVPNCHWLDPVGVTCNADGSFISGYCETTSGVHLTIVGQASLARAEAAVLTMLFGVSSKCRYPGVNVIGSAALMTATTSPGYGTVASGFVIYATNCTRQNAKVEVIGDRIWQTCEFVITGATATAQIFAPYSPATMGISVGDVYGAEFDVLLAGVNGGHPPLPSSLGGSLTTAKSGAGKVALDGLAPVYLSSFVEDVIGKCVLQPIKFNEASAALTNTGSSFGLLFSTDVNDGSTFKLGISYPNLVKLASDGTTLA